MLNVEKTGAARLHRAAPSGRREQGLSQGYVSVLRNMQATPRAPLRPLQEIKHGDNLVRWIRVPFLETSFQMTKWRLIEIKAAQFVQLRLQIPNASCVTTLCNCGNDRS